MLKGMKPAYPGLTPALLDFFGRQPGQTLQGFAAETKALTDADKAWFVEAFQAEGVKIG